MRVSWLQSYRPSVLVPLVVYVGLLVVCIRYTLPLRGGRNASFPSHYGYEASIQDSSQAIPPVQLLSSIFLKVDKDGDSLVSVEELSEFIQERTNEHISQALSENYGLFVTIDNNPKNGVISWEEYHSHFLQKNGVDEEVIRNPDKSSPLGRMLKEALLREKSLWAEAARNDPSSLCLTLDEFLAFRHPESSHTNLLSLAEDLLDKLDRNDDMLLTEDEFALLQMGEGEVNQDEAQRRHHFKTLLDSDNNGLADKEEILKYLDPKNPRHAREEAETLITLSDADRDGRISLSEILANMDLFLASKMVGTAQSFHDEF